MAEDIIGKSVERIDALAKVTGDAQYVHDLELQGMLHAKILKSPHAFADIVSIDTSKAEKLPGVWAVLTGEDVKQYKIGLYLVDKTILAVDKVRYHGEPVVAVAAETEEIAQHALELIEIEYNELEPVLDVKKATEKDSPIVHEDLGEYEHMEGVFFPEPGTNIANHFKIRKGDIDDGFAEADHIIENEFYLPQVNHVAMETHTSIARWKKGRKVKIWSSAQSPFAVRDLLGKGLGLPHESIEVVVPYVGGGFGGKAGIHFEPLVTLLSRAAGGRPVKFVASREEEFNSVPVRQALLSRFKTGVNEDGNIVAQEIEFLWDSGANADYGVNVTKAAGAAGCGPYEIDNVKLDSLTVYTNKLYGTAYRGFGHLEVLWATERQMEHVAKKLGMDPYELRKKNILRPGSRTITGEKLYEHSGSVGKCLDEVAKALNWDQKKEEPSAPHKARGRGLALLHKAPAMPTDVGAGALLKFNENGSVNLTLSLVDYGQGTYTALAQIVADQLSMPVDRVNVVWENNTETEPYDWQTVASKGLFISGNAVIDACKDLKKQMKEVAAGPLRASVDHIVLEDEKIYVNHHPDHYIEYKDIGMGYTYPNGNGIGGPLMGRGRYIAQGLTNMDKETGQGLPALDWTFGAHAVEVEIDKETGEYEVVKMASAFDLGRAINKQNVIGQIQGGMVQGFGSAVMEGYQFDGEGHIRTNTFTDYKIPTTMDIPKDFTPIIVETPQVDGPYGARGVAEHPMISVPPAIANAIQDALGITIDELPLTPENIIEHLENK